MEASTLWELIERRAGATPEELMAVDEDGRRMSFGEYRVRSEQVAAGLFALGVGEGTRVSWELPTWIESIVLVGALARLGALQNPILPIYREREVGFVLRQTRARLFVVPSVWRGFDYEAMARSLASASEGVEVLVVDKAGPDRGLASLPHGDPASLPHGDPASLPPAPPSGEAPGELPTRWVFYTSGTTADPKGARHTDTTIMACAAAMAGVLDLGPADRGALVFPFTHIGGIAWLLSTLMTGCRLIVVEAFDPPSTIPLLADEDVTLAGAGTPFHLAYLAAQRANPETRLFPSVRAFPGGAAPKPPQLHYDLKAEVGGVGIVSGYGLTECPILAMNTVRDPDDKLANTEGRATPGVSIRIVGPSGEVGAGQEGEIRVRGPQLFAGYLDPSLDAEAFDDQGYFRTGDLGALDAEGYLTITGRLKDIIIRKGENISAKEIEDLLYTHPKVADVAVIGLPDPASGERCCAVVACKATDEPLGLEEMVTFLKDAKLMVQKIPEQLELVESVPRNPAGKIEKHKLRERFARVGHT